MKSICDIISVVGRKATSQINNTHLNQLPETMRRELIEARRKRSWSQAELGKRVGLPQTHVSGIETGRVVPRFDTLLDLVRVLDRDLLMVPRELVPMVQALVRDHNRQQGAADEPERALYATSDELVEDHRDE